MSKARGPRSPMKSPSPSKSFLAKDSNLTSFTAWDVDSRVGGIESQFKELKAMVDSSLSERKNSDDALELAKTRGTAPDVHIELITNKNDSQGVGGGSGKANRTKR